MKPRMTTRIRNLTVKSRVDLTESRVFTLSGKPVINAFAESKVSPESVATEQNQDILADYLNCSSVHGIKYIGRISIKVALFGRLIWICIMIASLVCSCLMVHKFWNRYNSNPTIAYVKTFFEPVTSVPFPAVTVCPFLPNTAERREKIVNMLVPPGNMTTEELSFIIQHLHELAIAEVSARKAYLPYKQQLDEILKWNNWELGNLLEYSVSCEDIFHSCWFDGIRISCKDYLHVSHSSNGICCSFNYILEEEILGHVNRTPIYSTNYGMTSGLRVVLNKEILAGHNNSGPLSRVHTNSNGALVVVHHSYAYPGDILSNRILQANDEVMIEAVPTLDILPTGFLHTTPDGYTLPVCILDSKTAIMYIPVYRFSNCYTSCKVNLMVKTCGCVPFNFDPIARNSAIKSCTLSDYDCLRENEQRFRIVQDLREKEFTCICRQPCTNILYKVKVAKTNIDQRAIPASPAYKSVTNGQAVLRVFMQSQFFTVSETIPATTEISLLASLGGVFGLFLGCSILSAVELFYFAVLFYRAVLRAPRNRSK